jgi:hypothetical protein
MTRRPRVCGRRKTDVGQLCSKDAYDRFLRRCQRWPSRVTIGSWKPACSGGGSRLWRLESKRSVRPPAVVVAHVDAENVLELAAAENQEPVETFAADAADPALDVRVRVRRPHRRSDDPDPFAGEDRIERCRELAVSVVEEEAHLGGRDRRCPSGGCARAAASRTCPGCSCRRRIRRGGCRSRGRRARTVGEARPCRPWESRRRGSSRPAGARSCASTAGRAAVPAGCRLRRARSEPRSPTR